jgi:hypothetical protein
MTILHKKRFSLLIVLLFTAFFSDLIGQSYVPFLDESKIWSILNWSNSKHPNYLNYYSERFIDAKEDTIVNNTLLRRFNVSDYFYSEDTVNRIVYRHDLVQGDTHILYDFNLKIGDTVDWIMPYHYQLWDTSGTSYTSMKSTLFKVSDTLREIYGGRSRKVIMLQYLVQPTWHDCAPLYWIEGVGCGLSPLGWENGDCYNDGTIVECQRDSSNYSPIYGDKCTPVGIPPLVTPEIITISPNPSSGVFIVTSEQEITNMRVLSNTGELILDQAIYNRSFNIDIHQVPAGLYVLEVWIGNNILRKKILKG